MKADVLSLRSHAKNHDPGLLPYEAHVILLI
jgi:hypothetical protein